MAQLVECQSPNLQSEGSSPTWSKLFSHVCAYFGICGRHGITLPRLRLRGQLHYRTALIKPTCFQIIHTAKSTAAIDDDVLLQVVEPGTYLCQVRNGENGLFITNSSSVTVKPSDADKAEVKHGGSRYVIRVSKQSSISRQTPDTDKADGSRSPPAAQSLTFKVLN